MVIKKLNSIFHKHSRVLLLILAILVIIPFVFSDFASGGGCSNPDSQEVGKYNGSKVSTGEIRQFINKKSIIGGSGKDDWQSAFYEYCMYKYAEQMGIRVTDKEIAEVIVNGGLFTEFSQAKYDESLKANNMTHQQMLEWIKLSIAMSSKPPRQLESVSDSEAERFLKNRPEFGVYSQTIYDKFVKDNRLSRSDVEESIRIRLMQQKLMQSVFDSVVVSDGEVASYYAMNNPVYDLEFCTFGIDKYPVKDADVNARFTEILKAQPQVKEHADEYKKAVKRSMQGELAAAEVAKKLEAVNKLNGDAKIAAFKAISADRKSMTTADASIPMEIRYALFPQNGSPSANPGDIIGPVAASDAVYLVRVIKRNPGNAGDLNNEEMKKTWQQNLRVEKYQLAWFEFIQELMRRNPFTLPVQTSASTDGNAAGQEAQAQ